METVATDKAPKAVGPYAQAQKTGNLLFCCGQIGLDPETAQLVGDDVESQAKQVFKNIEAVLAAAGLGMNNVVKTTVFLKDMGDFPVINGLYAEAFSDHKPARSAVAVAGLPLGAQIEIECIAEFE